MGSKYPGPEPSLELPSFRLGRKKRSRTEDAPAPEAAEPDGAVAEDSADAGNREEPHAPEPEQEPGQASERTTDERTTVEPEPARDTEPAEALAPAAAPAGRRRAVRLRRVASGPTPDTTPEPDTTQAAAAEGDGEGTPAQRRERRELRLPALPGLAAAVVSGVVVGLLAVLMTGLSLRLCELARGTPSCGGPGLLLLVAILILLTYAGGWLLRAWRISDPMSTSFLAVGMLAVVTMLFFLDALASPWMILVVPVVAAATYALSWWVTAMFVDVEE